MEDRQKKSKSLHHLSLHSIPFNHVKETESGHIQEFDDTPGAERIQTYHRSGTFEEIHPDGTRVVKVVAKNYTVIMGENDIHIVHRTQTVKLRDL